MDVFTSIRRRMAATKICHASRQCLRRGWHTRPFFPRYAMLALNNYDNIYGPHCVCLCVRVCVCVCVCLFQVGVLSKRLNTPKLFLQEAQLSLRYRATRACQLKSCKVSHKCRRLAFRKLWNWRMTFKVIQDRRPPACSVSYTHLTLPTNREV